MDLHMHSYYSDGSDSPTQLVEKAKQYQIEVIALTDHDTVQGVEEFQSAAKQFGRIAIPAVEMTALYQEQEIHILGYQIDIRNEKLQNTLSLLQNERMERNLEIYKKLRKLNIEIDEEIMKIEFPHSLITRGNIAVFLTKKRIVPSIKDAFSNYLSKGGKAYVKRTGMDPFSVLTAIHESGGRSVLAHPCQYAFCEEQRIELCQKLKEAGLSGLELIYQNECLGIERHYRQLGNKLQLFISGGSDYHGVYRKTSTLGFINNRRMGDRDKSELKKIFKLQTF